MNCATSEDREEVWKAIPELARSFIEVLSLPKLGRWLSWNQCAEEQICEFWVGEMILEGTFKDVPDPDLDATSFGDIRKVGQSKSAAAQLAEMRRLGGGLKLAYRLMTTQLLECAKILQVVTRSSWTWYAHPNKTVKSPKQGLQDALLQKRRAIGCKRRIIFCFSFLLTFYVSLMGLTHSVGA